MNNKLECFFFFFFKQKTAYEIRKGDWSSDVCSSDLQREARRAEPDNKDSFPGCRFWIRATNVEGVPPREQRVDLEAPGQLEHVLQRARLGLRDVDRLLLLVDAGLHAVVADAVPGGGQHRVVDGDDAERRERLAARLDHVKLGDLLLERAAC